MLQNRFWNLLAKKIAGEASAREIQELEDLMRVHPDWHYSAQHIEDIWGLTIKENHLAAEDSFLRHFNRMKKIGVAPANDEEDDLNLVVNHPNRKNKRYLLFALLGLFVLAFALFLAPLGRTEKIKVSKTSEVSTRLGSRTRLLLPDGSTVWLNAGSKLIYTKDFGTTSREVTLSGEAFFDVTHIADLPFTINTPAMEIKVLGTTFNVKAYPNERTTETSVIKGRVEIIPKNRPGEKFVLKPNEKLVLSNMENTTAGGQASKTPMVVLGTITYSQKDSAVIETSWVENKLVFDDESFSSIAAKMERWYAVRIIFADKEIEELHLTGQFVNESIEQALAALQLVGNFHYLVNQNMITITK